MQQRQLLFHKSGLISQSPEIYDCMCTTLFIFRRFLLRIHPHVKYPKINIDKSARGLVATNFTNVQHTKSHKDSQRTRIIM